MDGVPLVPLITENRIACVPVHSSLLIAHLLVCPSYHFLQEKELTPIVFFIAAFILKLLVKPLRDAAETQFRFSKHLLRCSISAKVRDAGAERADAL